MKKRCPFFINKSTVSLNTVKNIAVFNIFFSYCFNKEFKELKTRNCWFAPLKSKRNVFTICIFKCFLIFIFLEYRKLTPFVLLLGTRRLIKIKNHLKSAARCADALVRFYFVLVVAEKIKISSKILDR